MPLRSQLPGSSPLPAGALATGIGRALTDSRGAREELRGRLAERFGGRAVLLGSGTQALQTALRTATTLAGMDGLPVAVPAYSCYDIVSACVGAAVRVVFYDVDPRTLAPDLDSLDDALGEGARVVLAGNLYGFPLDWDALRTRVASVEGVLIEDAAQGVGSLWRGAPGGTFGDATVLSFGRGKGWTGGGGGALVVRDDRLAEALDAESGGAWGLRPLVGSVAQWLLGRPGLYGLPRAVPGLALGETVYKAPSPPVGMSSLSAALVAATADAAQAELAHREHHAAVWSEALAEAGPWSIPAPPAGGRSSFLRFPIVTGGDSIRGRLLEPMERFGAASGYPRPLTSLKAAVEIAAPLRQRDLKGASELASRLLTLPTHSRVSPRDHRGVVDAFGTVVGANSGPG